MSAEPLASPEAAEPGTMAEDDEFSLTVRGEFAAWKARLPQQPFGPKQFPHPSSEGGLPDGWTIRATHQVPKANPALTEQDLFLVKREAGGWLAVRHRGRIEKQTIPNEFRETLADLYARVCARVDGDFHGDVQAFGPYEAMIREYVGPFYDPSVPAEAGEQMLVAFGARPTFMPAALT